MWHRWRTINGRQITAIQLGHTDDRTAYTGLEHAACNLADGAIRGNRMRRQRRAIAKAARTPAATTPAAATIQFPLHTSRQW